MFLRFHTASAMTSHWLIFSFAVTDSVRCSKAVIASMAPEHLPERQLCIEGRRSMGLLPNGGRGS
jgi:hypothetical protein